MRCPEVPIRYGRKRRPLDAAHFGAKRRLLMETDADSVEREQQQSLQLIVHSCSSVATGEENLPPAPAFRMENHFSVKVLQVFTGAGVGCVVGIGVGRLIYLGIALKPRVIHGIQSSIAEPVSSFTSKLKDSPGESATSNHTAGPFPSNGQTPNCMSMDLEAEAVKSNFGHTSSNEISQVQPTHGLYGQNGMQTETITRSRTEKVIANFLQSPLFQNDTNTGIRDAVLKHERVIEELRDENEKLRQVLIEELKVSPTKLQPDRTNGVKASTIECFDCRRRSRKSNR